MVASLLIAAMLLVVSCTQEVAPKNELVEVKLSTVFGRDIEITGGTKTDSLKYKYTMTPNWIHWESGKKGIGSEEISGIVKTETPVAPTPAINATPVATTPVEPAPTPVEESPEVARAKIIRGAIAKKSKHMPEILKYIRETGAKPSLKDITEEQTKQILEFVKTIPDDVA